GMQPASNDLSLYFHGISHGLSWLYKVAPHWPWYGLMLYILLWGATSGAFLILRQSGLINNRFYLFYFFLFFLASWAEHIYLFNYMRVPLLLAGVGYLIFLQLPGNKNNWLVTTALSGLMFLVALCIRPSAALLGVVVVGPAVFLLTAGSFFSWLKFRPILLYMGVGAFFFIFLNLNLSPAAKQYQRLDWLKSTVLDFQIYEPQPKSKADSLAFAAIDRWMLADTRVINESFYQKAGRVNFNYVLTKVAPAKLTAVLDILVRDHFLVVSLNIYLLFFLFWYKYPGSGLNRNLIIVYQVYFWLLVLGIGVWLKLPPRVITPCLSLYTLVNGALYLKINLEKQDNFKWSKIGVVLLVILVGLQFYKISHRAHWQNHNQKTNEAFITALRKDLQGQIIVSNVLPDYFRSLSPFRNYDFGTNTLFFLTGWHTLDPANRSYNHKLTSQPDFARAVLTLSRNNNTIWILSPGFYEFLKVYFNTFYHQQISLQPTPIDSQGLFPGHTYRPNHFLP
ncbi:MAG: hypothetical protein JWQ14_1429, partial [Adhaeribacter sp.]|nr:hypothetical protein [Adhaeribacter sp.]